MYTHNYRITYVEELVPTGGKQFLLSTFLSWLDSKHCEKEKARAVKARAQRRIAGWTYTTEKFLPKVRQKCKIPPPIKIDDMRLGVSFCSKFSIVPLNMEGHEAEKVDPKFRTHLPTRRHFLHLWKLDFAMYDLGGSFPLTNNRQVFYMQRYIPGNVSQLRSTLVEQDISVAWSSTASKRRKHVLGSCKIPLRLFAVLAGELLLAK